MTEPNITINPYNDSGIFFNDDNTTLLHYGGVKKIDINSTHEEIPTAQAVYEFHKMNQDINIVGVPPIIVTKDEQKNEGKIVTNSISLNVQFQKIMFNNGIFVAISSQGGIATSVNKTDWSFQKSGTTNDLLDIVYTQGKFIIIGENGTIITSSDGITWILQLNAPSENLLFIVAYNNNIVITGSNNVYHSTDAETWTSTLSPAKQVIVCNNQFIALDNVLHTSNDGITWTANLAPSTQLYSIAYSTNENIYFTGDNANFYSSSDLNEWIILSPVSGYINKIIYENGKFYAISSAGYIYWGISTNMQQSTAFNKTLTDIIYEDGIFYVVGNSFFGYSFDGETWQEITTDVIFKGYINEIAVGTNYIGNVIKSEENDYTWYLSDVISPTDFIGYSNGVIGVGNNGYLVKSSDGKNWISSYITTEDLNKIVFNGTNYFICGTNGYLASSNDLNVWNVKITNIVSPILNMATNGNIVIAISYTGYVISSTNGGETFIIYQVNNNTWSNIIYGNGTFVISGNNNGLITTTDGINFTTINLNVAPSGQSTVVNDLTYGNNLFIGYRYNDIYIYSNDNAVTWIEKTFPVSMFTLNKIKFLNGNFIAVGYTKNSNTYSFTVLYSTDAEIWNLVVISSFTSVIINIDDVSSNDIEFDGTNYYIIGSGHNIYMSNDLTTWIQQTIIVDNYASNNPFYKCLYTSNTLFVSNRVDMIANNETIETFDINEILNGIYNLTGVLENKAYGNGLLTSSSPKNTWDIIQFPQTIIYLSVVGDFSISYYSIYSNFSTIVHTSTHILNKIYYLNNIYIVVGNNVLITSNDSGTTWTEQTITYNAVAALYYIDYVIIGSNGTVDHSSDLSTWINLPITDTLVDGIVVGTNIYILGQNTIYTTSDFTSWTPILISNINPLKKLITNGILITQSEIFSSNDMLTWTNENQTGTFNDVSFNTDATVIVGSQITSKINESENYAVLSIPGTLNAINNMIAVGSYVSVIDTYSSETISTEYTIEIDRITGILRSGDDSTGSDQDLVTDGYLQEQLEKVNEQNKVIVEGEYPIIVTKETVSEITSYTVSLNSSLNDIYYANSMYIAVGKTGTIMTSFNGENWSYQTSTVTYDLNKIIYDGTYWIAIGNHGIIITSSNGIDWIKRESNTIENLLQIKSKNETSIIIGSNAFLRSIDSITWESITSSLSLITNLFLINDNFIVSDNNNYIYSSNGQTWSTLIAFSNLSEAIYGINNYVFGTSTGSIFTSASLDGPWTSRYTSTNNLTGSIYVNNIFYFGSENNIVISSSDTISWINTSTSTEIHGFSYNNGLLYGYGTNICKLNETNWDPLMAQNIYYITKISDNIAVGNNFIGKITFGESIVDIILSDISPVILGTIENSSNEIIGYGSTTLKTTDKKTWQMLTKPADYTTTIENIIQKVIKISDNLYIGIYANYLYSSIDAIDWTIRIDMSTLYGYSIFMDVIYAGDLIVAIGAPGAIWTSSDGINWTQQNNGIPNYTYQLTVITYVNSTYYISGWNGTFFRSSDAITWLNTPSLYSSSQDLIYNQGKFYIVCNKNGYAGYYIVSSPDTITWTELGTIDSFDYQRISKNGTIATTNTIDGKIYDTNDFLTWNNVSYTPVTSLTSVYFENNTDIVTGLNNVIIRGEDKIWNSLSTGINELLINTNYIDNSYISCGQYLHILNVETISGLETKYIVSIAPPNILKAGDVSTGSDTDLVSDGYLQEQLQFEKGEVDIKAEYPIIVTKEYEEGTGGEMMISANTFGANVKILDMSYAKNLYVAVGGYGMIMTSSDKKNWTYQNSNTNAANLSTIVYDGTQWIATGNNGFIITSTNGSDWITRNTGTASSYSYTITNNGTTITCSNNYSAPSVMKSTDGENWIEIFNSSNVLWCGYVNNKFFITFGNQTIVWSDDNGVTWSTPVTPSSGNSIRTIYYHNGIYFAGANTFVVTSPDLINWTQRLDNGGTITLFFTVNNMVFVGSFSEIVPYCYANDLINWNKFNIGGLIRQVLYENNIVHALGYNYETVFYMTSSDGLNWIQANISKSPTFDVSSKFTNNIIYGNGYIGEKINMTTSQLSTFTYQNINRNSTFYDVLGDENGIILIGSSGMIAISDNGKIWNSVYTNTQINAYRIIKFNSTYIIGYSYGSINISTDRTTWTSYQIGTFGDNYTINDMIVGDNLIIIAMNNGNIGTSSDLTTWSSIQYGTYKYTSVTYNNGMYVLSTSDSSSLIYCSGDPTILSSWNTLPVNAVANKVKTLNNIIFAFLADGSINYYNGSIWTNVDIGNIINDIEYNSGLYVVVGQTGSIYTSSDLTTWTQRTSSTTNNLNYILYANSIYTVTGDNRTLLQSSNAINWQMINVTYLATIINYTKLLYNQNHIWFMSSNYFYGDVGTRVWKSRVNPVGSQKINKVIYGNSFIAVGGENTTGYILESIDGNIWNLLSSGNTPYIDIAYYNQIYIIISSDKVVRIDENGVFNETTISGFTNMKKIIYGNNGFFIINSDGKIAKSTADGTGWTTVSSDIGSLNSISYATYYVAVGENMIKYSNDGLTWTTITTSYVLYDVLQSINDYRCYACGKNGLIVISTNLSTWNVLQAEDINKTDLYHMGVNPDTQTYYAVGSNGEAYSSYIGQTPVVFPLNTNNTLNNVMFVNNTLFIVGNSGYLFEGQNNNYKNNDGFITQNNWQSIAYGNETYVIVADNGAIYSTEYDTIEIPQANINSIITNNLNLNGTLKNNVGDVIAYGTGVITTTDKKTWPMILNPSNQTFIKIIQFSNNIYTSFDNNGGIYVSSNLKNWTLRYIIENMTDMIYENNILIMTGNHDIYTSTTFLSSWDWRYTGPETVKKIIYNAGIYVIIDINGAIIRSIDTITWISSPSGLSTIADISVVNGKFFIIGSTGSNKVIYSSSDALTWTQETIISSTNALIAIDNSGTTISNNQLFDNTYNNVPITVTPAPTLYSTYFANNINVVTGTRGFIYVKINDIWEQFTTNYSYVYGLTNTNYIDNTFISVGDFIHFINITYSGSGTTTYTVSIAPPLSIVTNILKASNVSTGSDTDLVSDGYLQSQLSNIEIEKVWTTEDIGSLSTVLTQYYFAGHNTIINNIVLGSLYPNIIIANIDGTVINTIAYPANMTNFNSKISANTTHMIGYLTGDAFPENIILYEIASNTVTVIPYNDPNPELTTVDLSTVSCDDNYIWYVYYSNSLSGYTMNAVSLVSTFLPHVENSLINNNYSYSRSQIHIGQYLYWHNTSTEQIFLTTFDPLTSTITSTVTDIPTTVLQTSSSAFMFCRETNEVFVYGLFSSNWMYKFTLGSVISIDVWNDIGLENQYELRIIYNGTNYVISNYGNLNQETIIQGYIYNLGYSNGLISGYTSNNILFTQTTSTQKKVVFNTNPKYQFVTPIVGGGVTTIDVSSTNDYIPTAKAVYSSLIEKYTINNIVDETGWLDGVQYNELGTVVAVQSNLGEIHIKPFIYINSNYIEITNINSNVLSNIEATRIFLPESIKTLSDNNFSNINNCVNYLSNSFISFGNNIYSNSNCYYTIIPEGITTIGNNIVNTTTAKYGYIPDTLISSGSNCFTNSQLAVLSIPNKAIVVTPFDLTVNTLVIRNYEGDTTYQGPTTISVTTIVNLSAIPDTTLAIAFPSATIVNGIPASIINDIPEEHLYALKSQIAISNATDSYTKEETDALIQYKFSLDNVPTTSGFVDGVTYTNDIVTAVDDINHIYIKPNVYNDITITTIADDVIYNKQLVQTINIPPTITTIGNNFASNLTSANVVINTFINVTSIGTNYEAGSNILYGCIPDPITSLPDGAFSHSSVNYLYIPRNCIDFAATSFNNTQINILNMPHILLNNDGTTNLITANTLILRDVDGADTWKTSMDTLIADITDTIINLTAIPNTFFNGKWTATNIVNTIPTNTIAQIPEIHYFNLIDSKVQTTIDAYTKDEVDAIVSTNATNIQDQLNLRLARIINYNADLNNALFGMYQIITGATNTPPNENVNGSLLIVYKWDTTNIRQIYYPNNSQKLWSRSMINGIWQSWLLISNGTYTYQSLTYTAIPIANLTATIAALPSTINHTVTINLTSASTVASVVTINNLQGLGSLIINGNASSLQRLILQNNTLQQIIINNIIATDTTQNYAFTIQNNSNAITLNSIQATGNSSNANPSSGIAVIDNTGNIYVNNSTFSNKAYGIYSSASDTLCSNITLSNNTNGYYSTNGSFIHIQSHNETLLDTAHFNQQLGGVIFMPDGTIFAVATSEVENEQPIQNGEEISITKDTWKIRFISQNNGNMPLNLILVNNDVILHSIAWQLSQRVGNVIKNVSGNPNIAAGGQITLISNSGQSNSPMAVWNGTIGDITTGNFYSFKTFYVPATGSFKCTITKH